MFIDGILSKITNLTPILMNAPIAIITYLTIKFTVSIFVILICPFVPRDCSLNILNATYDAIKHIINCDIQNIGSLIDFKKLNATM